METGAGLIVHETDGEHDELASAPWFFRGAFLVFTAPSVQTGARPINGRWSADGIVTLSITAYEYFDPDTSYRIEIPLTRETAREMVNAIDACLKTAERQTMQNVAIFYDKDSLLVLGYELYGISFFDADGLRWPLMSDYAPAEEEDLTYLSHVLEAAIRNP